MLLSHQRSLQGSNAVAMWLVATIAGGIVRTRTVWLTFAEDAATAAALFTAVLGLQTVLLALVSISTKRILRPSIRATQVRSGSSERP